jgi:hypothetical protein
MIHQKQAGQSINSRRSARTTIDPGKRLPLNQRQIALRGTIVLPLNGRLPDRTCRDAGAPRSIKRQHAGTADFAGNPSFCVKNKCRIVMLSPWRIFLSGKMAMISRHVRIRRTYTMKSPESALS